MMLAFEVDREGKLQEEKVTHTLLGVVKSHPFSYPPHLLQAGMILGLSPRQCPVLLLLAGSAGPICPLEVSPWLQHTEPGLTMSLL